MLIILLVTSLLRGSGKSPSIANVNRCDPADITIQVILFGAAIIFTIISAIWVKRDFANKQTLGYNFVKGEI
jgi:hypothetical protein